MKKLINSPETVLAESLDGFAAAHADIVVECVSSTGTPQRLWPAVERLPGTVIEDGWLANRYYPSPEMHELAAAKLAEACRSILSSTR